MIRGSGLGKDGDCAPENCEEHSSKEHVVLDSVNRQVGWSQPERSCWPTAGRPRRTFCLYRQEKRKSYSLCLLWTETQGRPRLVLCWECSGPSAHEPCGLISRETQLSHRQLPAAAWKKDRWHLLRGEESLPAIFAGLSGPCRRQHDSQFQWWDYVTHPPSC